MLASLVIHTIYTAKVAAAVCGDGNGRTTEHGIVVRGSLLNDRAHGSRATVVMVKVAAVVDSGAVSGTGREVTATVPVVGMQ